MVADRAFRFCAGISAILLWSQFLLTSRYADIPGSLHGWKQPLYVVVLILATAALLLPYRQSSAERRALDNVLANIVFLAGLITLGIACFVWFPPAAWAGIPYLDNWVTRYLSTVDGIALLKQGTAVGWNWDFLGGYQTSSDITQGLTIVAFLPMLVFGDAVGFHLTHILLFVSIPAIVYVDLRLDAAATGSRTARLGAGLAAFGVMSMSYILLRSGDTNSLAGVATTMMALMAGHAAAVGRRWGGPLLVVALTMVAWSHTGFFLYAGLFLLVDAVMARDIRRAIRAAIAGACATVAVLPLTWELWRFPDYFIANNVILDPNHTIDWFAFAKKIFYNVELLWLPGRWFNDSSGLTYVLLPLLLFVAWRGTGRTRFYAVVAVTAFALTRWQTADTAYLFVRPHHLLSVCTPVALAGLVELIRRETREAREAWRSWSIAALTIVYLQIWVHPVPHVREMSRIEPNLIAQMRGLDGALVLLENTPHRDMDVDPARDIEPAPVPVHFESAVPRLTGVRLYAGMWDGWQWCPQRDEVLAGGAFRGASLSVTPADRVHAELTRWGVRHLFVWSRAARQFFDGDPRFIRRWSSDPWIHYEFTDADPRDVVVTNGRGRITTRTPHGARIELESMRAGDRVVLRTHYYPAWDAFVDGQSIALAELDGRMTLNAPRDGDMTIELRYPKRRWLLILALATIVIGSVVMSLEHTR
jgi:hypothetical protein